ncbi:permease [Candidatus Woesearchaeota archaeon CG_4_10_14_0_8_um_filter_47_5]|nr:MAG: permease [Candidatus Woesearchaeota archaeon CG_4_10_14_0_8_um_filter_47_5]
MHRTKNTSHKIALILVAALVIGALLIAPEYIIGTLAEADYSLVLMILYYLPGFFILLSLFEVWLPEEVVVAHLGRHSGIKGAVYSFVLGTLLPGPIYIAFPLAASMVKKGVSPFNAILFIGAWSSLKLGEEVFEFQFLGPRFAVLRLVITIPFVIAMAWVMDRMGVLSRATQTKS